jgi:hypothetical protein
MGRRFTTWFFISVLRFAVIGCPSNKLRSNRWAYASTKIRLNRSVILPRNRLGKTLLRPRKYELVPGKGDTKQSHYSLS